MTYLFDGRVMHRDSEGNELEIAPGAMNLMTAGRGIAHSERTPQSARKTGQPMFGIQSWIALPRDREEIAPSFQHFDAASLPVVEDKGVWARVIAGSAFGQTAPVETVSDWLYAEVVLEAGAQVPFDADHEERAIYVAEGEVEIAGDSFEAPRLLVFRPGDRITVTAKRRARAHVSRRSRDGRASLHLVELRLVAQGAHRGGEGRLEDGPVSSGAGRNGVHPAPRAVTQQLLTRRRDRGKFRLSSRARAARACAQAASLALHRLA